MVKISTVGFGRLVLAGALMLAAAPLAQAADKRFDVTGLAIQGPAGPNEGHAAGPNYIVSRTLELAIWPCSTGFGCPADTPGFFGKVTVDPESVERLSKNGNWSYHMLAKQTIGAGDIDFTHVFGFEWLGVQSFPTAAVITPTGMLYGCDIKQTLVATGDLTKPEDSPFVTDITTSFAKNVYATWTITSGSTCVDPTSGKTVKVTGRGTLVYDPANGVFAPTYNGSVTVAGPGK